ncbi:MAG TPA: D-alanine--D-alanine ligase family protein, partial [Acidimicrobiales bacterium]|nr:D-alanine--D-alanine ligase family protein [Acidimicrobiales bacterium]
MTRRARLVVLFGGRSAEHEVSCTSAVSVLKAVDTDRYDVDPVGVTRAGRWVRATGAWRVLAESGAQGLPATLEATGPEVGVFETLSAGAGGLPVVVFPLLHGPFGEDGTIQGLCEVADVPYVGSGVLGSAACMDKDATKRLVMAAGLTVAPWLSVRDDQAGTDTSTAALGRRVAHELGWPVFVKPAALGSSVGVTRVPDEGALTAALAEAFSYGEWAVVEEAIVGREIECGVLGDRPPVASVPGEVRPSREFYDYDDKYLEGRADLLVPAPLPPEVVSEVQAQAVAAFTAVRAEAMARVDFFWDEGGRGLVVNEVNTIPGFTPISMYPRMWEASGVAYPELVDRLVTLALERHARQAGRVG